MICSKTSLVDILNPWTFCLREDKCCLGFFPWALEKLKHKAYVTMMFSLTFISLLVDPNIGITVVCHGSCVASPGSLCDLSVCVLIISIILGKWAVVWSWYWCDIQTIWIMLQIGTINCFVCSGFRFSLVYSDTHRCGFPVSLQYNLFSYFTACNDCLPFTSVLLLSISSVKTRHFKPFCLVFLHF